MSGLAAGVNLKLAMCAVIHYWVKSPRNLFFFALAKQRRFSLKTNSQTVFALLTGPARIAARVGMSLEEFRDIAEAVFVRELDQATSQQSEVHAALQVSSSTMQRVRRRTFELFDGGPSRPLAERIQWLCWLEPLSTKKLARLVSDVREDALAECVGKLVAGKQLREEGDRTPRYVTPEPTKTSAHFMAVARFATALAESLIEPGSYSLTFAAEHAEPAKQQMRALADDGVRVRSELTVPTVA